ncbi:MAG: hypothetical protein JJT76_10880 [Clostridiaceae bacterium]|nr:hypothetical protein [Clostridiaceae bacterium]
MANNFKEYTKRFVKRNFSLNGSLRENETEEIKNNTTIMDLILLPFLTIITLSRLVEKGFSKKDK